MPDLTTPQELSQVTLLGQRSGVQTGIAVWQGQQVFFKALVSRDPETVARFEHEGQVAASLSHPLVIPVLWQSRRELIFPLLPGGTLRDLARCGPMSTGQATAVVWGILQAVVYLHAQGVTHHDLKPENVLLVRGKTTPDAVRLIDFGMSHARHLKLDIHSGTRMGTPHFMAPEQFRGIRGDPRSDLYSVGVLLFDCLAGHPPYEDALGWLVGISENLAELPGPRELHPFMRAAIQRDMTLRPQSAAEMLALLEKARQDLKLPSLTLETGV